MEGTWNIDKSEGTIKDSTTGLTSSYSHPNAGTYTFAVEKTGSYSYTYSGAQQNGTFTWSNTSNSVTMNTTKETRVYTATTNESNRQVWTSSYKDYEGDQNSETLTMTKK